MVEKAGKPIIEDVIHSTLSGDALKNALDIVAYLRENKMTPVWSATNAWTVSYKTFRVCFIRMHGSADYHKLDVGSWHILPFIGEYEKKSLPDELKEIVWANKKNCKICGQCALKLDNIFGKKFTNSCEGSILFLNPDNKAIECVKKLIELRRNDIKDGKVKKHVYVAMKNR
jgi:hypothetical protein